MDRVYSGIGEEPWGVNQKVRELPGWEKKIFLGYSVVLAMLLFLRPAWALSGMTLFYLALISFWDWRWYRIPNGITFQTVVAGMFYHTLVSGWSGWIASFGGLLLGGALLMTGYLFKKMGAGDVKAMAALGAIWGPIAIWNMFLWTALFGGITALGVLLIRGKIMEIAKRYWLMAETYLWTHQLLYVAPTAAEGRHRLPYGVVISGGVLLWYLLGSLR